MWYRCVPHCLKKILTYTCPKVSCHPLHPTPHKTATLPGEKYKEPKQCMGTIRDPWKGTPSTLVLDDTSMDVPLFWPFFLTFWGLKTLFWGYFFSSTNTETIFWGIKLPILTEFHLFGPKFHFCLNLLGFNFQWPAAPTPRFQTVYPQACSSNRLWN